MSAGRSRTLREACIARNDNNRDRGFVVVTGTSTGIGAATAGHLAQNGFDVFAGVRRAEDGAALRAEHPERVTPLIIDVTDESSMQAAATAVAAAVGDYDLIVLASPTWGRVLGLKMYPPNLKADFAEQARAFVDGLVEGVLRQPVPVGVAAGDGVGPTVAGGS